MGSLIGGMISSKSAKKENDRQYDLARNSIKYRVEDAQNAGIHPLYAMGAPTLSSSSQTDTMGQAVADASTQAGKAMSSGYQKEMEKLNLENARADLRSKQLRNADFVKQSLSASNLSRLTEIGNTKHDGDLLKMGGGVTLKKKYTPASEVEDYLGETGIPYSIWNTIDHLMEDAPKAGESLKSIGKNITHKKRHQVSRWWREFKRKRGW